jgi:predicted Rossmann-fold nucleotide-binding protein
VILFGRQYWKGLVDWLTTTVLPAGKISSADPQLLTVTDDVDEAVATIVAAASAESAQVDAEERAYELAERVHAHDAQ